MRLSWNSEPVSPKPVLSMEHARARNMKRPSAGYNFNLGPFDGAAVSDRMTVIPALMAGPAPKNRGCRWRTPVPDPTALTATEQVDVSAICPVCRAGLIPQLNARTLHGPKADRPEPGMHAKALGRRPSSRALVNSPVHRSWNSAAAWRVVLRKQRSMEVVRRTFGSRFLVRPEYCPGGHAGRTTTFVLTGVRA